MSEPHFLTADQVLHAHRSLIDVYGGSHGLRDEGLFRSAIAMPEAWFGGKFLHSDLFEMAAAYLYHLVQNHPFLDGNKRIGAATAVLFLGMNNIRIVADEDGLVEITLQTAQGKCAKPEIAEFFRQRVLPQA